MSDEEGHKVCSSEWLGNIDLAFLSDEYTDKTKKYFRDHFGVTKFSNKIIINDIILSDDYCEKVQDSIFNYYHWEQYAPASRTLYAFLI